MALLTASRSRNDAGPTALSEYGIQVQDRWHFVKLFTAISAGYVGYPSCYPQPTLQDFL